MTKRICDILYFFMFLAVIVGLFDGISLLLNFPIFSKTKGWEHHSMEDGFLRIFISMVLILIMFVYSKFIEPKLASKKGIIKIHFSKCPKCKENFTYSELNNGKCKYCEEVDTIDMDEYYEKFPDKS